MELIHLAEDDRLLFEVRDDGTGFDIRAAGGAGLTNMRDRVTAAGGELDVASVSGQGVVVTRSIPIPS